jgi:hypothetical protein
VPTCDLALWRERVLLLDSGASVLVWCGSESGGVQGVRGTAALRIARQRAALRTPRPFVAAFEQGESMARLLLSRLYPLHSDRDELQLAAFPDLALLNAHQRKALNEQFFDTDQESFNAFRSRMLAHY